MPKLRIIRGDDKGAEVIITEGTVIVGRRTASGLQISDAKSSRSHCQISQKGRGFFLKDLSSRNGTSLNGKKVTGMRMLEVGDRIGIGNTVIEVQDEAIGQPITLKVPGYKMLEIIGRGGMGTVYKAKQVSMDRIVALKVLHERLCKDSHFIERFLSEARIAGKLNHPNLIHVHDVSEYEGTYFFAMEYVDGQLLKTMIKRKGRLPVPQTLEITQQIVSALAFAHENEILHRDIKPGNIMITEEGEIKIADLGIAKTFDESKEGEKRKRIVGTPHYMAPEQAMGKPLTAAVDIYSLGATIYHLLTGETPFAGDTATDVVRMHLQSELPPIQAVAPEVPEGLIFMVERMMAKKPENRYPNMEAVGEDLERIQDDIKAEIERLPAGESSIMQAIPAQAEEAEPKGPGLWASFWGSIGESPLFIRIAFGVAAIMLIGLIGVLIWYVTK